jgi:hypothetical protein
VPAHERLMREGTTLTNHMINSCVCTPSRSVLGAREIVVERAAGDAGHPDEVVDHCGVGAFLGEDLHRGFDDPGACAARRCWPTRVRWPIDGRWVVFIA